MRIRWGMAQYIDLTARRAADRTSVARLAPAWWATALLVAAAGALHLYLWFDYFHRVHVIGVLFLVNAATGLALAATLLASPSDLVLLAAVGYAATTLAAFAVSTRWGLFGYRETFWGSWQEAAGGVELAAALLGAFLLAVSAGKRRRLR
jgi:hypothetical protein